MDFLGEAGLLQSGREQGRNFPGIQESLPSGHQLPAALVPPNCAADQFQKMSSPSISGIAAVSQVILTSFFTKVQQNHTFPRSNNRLLYQHNCLLRFLIKMILEKMKPRADKHRFWAEALTVWCKVFPLSNGQPLVNSAKMSG